MGGYSLVFNCPVGENHLKIFSHFQFAFDYNPGDIFGCVADVGWITGHSYVVYGPLSNGATTVLFESVPTYPDPGAHYNFLLTHIFYVTNL